MQFPKFISEILNTLYAAGFEAYLVGGCVRDSILGRIPGDWDITTNALPNQVMALFPHCIPTGIQHGTVTVLWEDDCSAEITTYRTDGIYEDGRHPKQVTFSGNLEDDLSRRDFTMNAMAYSPIIGFVDLFQGQSHIAEKTIYCVGDPLLRFTEDALRMLRALRFSAVLDFALDSAILDAIEQLHGNIEKVSIERIQEEFSKILLANNTQALQLLLSTGLLSHFLPEVTELPYNRQFHMVPSTLPSRLAVFLSSLAPESAKSILKRLRYSNAVCNETISILKNIALGLPKTEAATRQRMADKNLAPGFACYLELQQSLNNNADLPLTWHQAILQRGDCIHLAQLAINGNDLTTLGITNGQKKGTVLQALLQAVLENPSLNTKEQLIEIALRIR